MENERTSLLPGINNWESARHTTSEKEYGHSFRRDLWTIMRYRASIPHRSLLQRASYTLEVSVLVLILLNVVLAMWESSKPNQDSRSDWYDTFLYVSTIIFSFEYFLRVWSCVEDERFASPFVGRLQWMIRPMSLIDLVVLIPFYVEIASEYESNPSYRGILTLRGLRLLRIMSFLRLERSYKAFQNLRLIFIRKSEELWVVSYLTAVIVLTASTTIFFIENPAQPNVFSSIGVCAWWSIETITSLGYGDIVPITSAGRFFSSILALWGIVLFTIPSAVLGSGFIEVMWKTHEEEKKRFEEKLCNSFMGELHAINSMTFKNGQIPSSSGGISSDSDYIKEIRKLQNQIDSMMQMQELMQVQLRTQKSQFDAIQKLIETLVPKPAELPPFSHIIVPSVPSELES